MKLTTSTRAVCCFLACALACAACSSGEIERPTSPPRKERGVGTSTASTTDEDTEEAEDPTAEEDLRVAMEPAVAEDEATEETDEPEEAKPAEEAPKQRDLGEELKTMLSGATACLKPRSAGDAPKQIDVSVLAMVMPGGGVGRSEASSGALDATEIACVRRLIEAARFAPPIEDAPRPVSTVLRIEQAPQPPAADTSGKQTMPAPTQPAQPPTPAATPQPTQPQN